MNEDQKHDEIVDFFNAPDWTFGIPDTDLVLSHALILWPEMTLEEFARIMNRLMANGKAITSTGKFIKTADELLGRNNNDT